MCRQRVAPFRIGVALIAAMLSIDGLASDVSAASAVASPADIGCQLLMPARLSRAQPAVLTLTVHNRSKQTMKLLKRNTPFEGWWADSLIVERDGQPVPYSGAMAKRMPPTVTEYLRLKPGASYRHRAALQRGYDVSQPGRYRVQWRGEWMDALLGNGAPNPDRMWPQTVPCAAVSFVRLP